jgi:hypothetical protein
LESYTKQLLVLELQTISFDMVSSFAFYAFNSWDCLMQKSGHHSRSLVMAVSTFLCYAFNADTDG